MPRPAAFTLVELLIVIALMGVLVGIALPHFQPPLGEQLESFAAIVAADLDYARNLAVTNNSTYRVTFSAEDNAYFLTHSGSNAALHTLPLTPFRPADDPPDRHTCDLDSVPHLGANVYVHAVFASSGPPQTVSDLEFSPLGGTTRAAATVVWLRCGSDESRRFLPLTVNPVTGLVTVGEIQLEPPSVAAEASFAGAASHRISHPSHETIP